MHLGTVCNQMAHAKINSSITFGKRYIIQKVKMNLYFIGSNWSVISNGQIIKLQILVKIICKCKAFIMG